MGQDLDSSIMVDPLLYYLGPRLVFRQALVVEPEPISKLAMELAEDSLVAMGLELPLASTIGAYHYLEASLLSSFQIYLRYILSTSSIIPLHFLPSRLSGMEFPKLCY